MSTATTTTFAPAKVNVCLFLGGTRADGRHELVTLFESVGLVDLLQIAPRSAGPDEVVCDGVAGRNLVADALDALRAAGWAAPPVTVTITKRIPVAAGMGGGSADAAAVLRHAPTLAPVADAVVARIAAGLGADVPSQLDPGVSLGTGAGEVVQRLPDLPDHALVVVPAAFPLATADVYREADRLGLGRPARELEGLAIRVRAAALAGAPVPAELVVNDLQPAALSLHPEIGRVLDEVRAAGADRALVCGSGPTVIGLFWEDGSARAAAARDVLRAWGRRAGVAAPARTGFLPSAPNE